jgi:hypothetical protein
MKNYNTQHKFILSTQQGSTTSRRCVRCLIRGPTGINCLFSVFQVVHPNLQTRFYWRFGTGNLWVLLLYRQRSRIVVVCMKTICEEGHVTVCAVCPYWFIRAFAPSTRAVLMPTLRQTRVIASHMGTSSVDRALLLLKRRIEERRWLGWARTVCRCRVHRQHSRYSS